MCTDRALVTAILAFTWSAAVGAQTHSVRVGDVTLALSATLDAPGMAILNPGAGSRIGLRQRGPFRPVAKVAGMKLAARTQQVKASIDGGAPRPLRFVAFDRAYTSSGDGAIGVDGLNSAVVWLGRPTGGSPSHILRLKRRGGKWQGEVAISGHAVDLRIDLSRSASTANRSAGDLLVLAGLGRRTGRTQNTVVAFGIVRPSEEIGLRGFAPGGKALAQLQARISPERAASLSQAAEAVDDPDENATIVVTGKSARSRERVRPYIVLGQDWSEGCPTARFVRATGRLELFCAI